MKWIILLSMCVASAAGAFPKKPAQPAPGSRVTVESPAGVTVYARESGASIEYKLSTGDPVPLTAQGARVDSREDVTIDGCTGRMWSGQDNMTPPRRRLIAEFGAGERSVELTASFPPERRGELEPALRAAFLAARWDRSRPFDPSANLLYHVTPTPRLKLSEGDHGHGRFTPTGTWPARDASEPEIRISMTCRLPFPLQPRLVTGEPPPDLTEIPFSDRRAYALAFTDQEFVFEPRTLVSVRPVTIDGLEGHEIVARGPVFVSSRVGCAPQTLCQVVLFDGDQMHALSARLPEDPGDWLEEARTFMSSFRRRRGQP